MKRKRHIFDIRLLPMDIARCCYFLMRAVFWVRKRTPEGERWRGKLRGGAILAANHSSFRDPILLAVSFFYRRVFFLIGEVVMADPVRNFLLKGVGGIKIDRNIADLEAIKKSVSVLKRGKLLAMFPQGGIQKGEQVESVKAGAVLMALQAGVPIIPIHLQPGKHWYRPTTMIIGQPVDPAKLIQKKMPSTADLARVSQVLLEEMNRCAAATERERESV